MSTRVHLITWVDASAPTPSAGLTSRNPKPVPSEGRFQDSPVQTSRRGKRMRGTPTSPRTLLRRKGGRNLFHLFGVECPGSGLTCENAPGRVFLVNRTRFPKSPLQSRRLPEVTTLLLPSPLPNRGKTQGKLHGKNSSTVPKLQRTVKKVRC